MAAKHSCVFELLPMNDVTNKECIKNHQTADLMWKNKVSKKQHRSVCHTGSLLDPILEMGGPIAVCIFSPLSLQKGADPWVTYWGHSEA